MSKLARTMKDQSSAPNIEYGLIAAGIVVAIATVVFTMGIELGAKHDEAKTVLGVVPASEGSE